MTRSAYIGTFSLPRKWLQDPGEAVQRIMSQCVVTETHFDYYRDAIDYVAFCPRWFRKIDEGETLPHYRWDAYIDGHVEAHEVKDDALQS